MKSFITILCFIFCNCLGFSQNIISKVQDCKKTELYADMLNKDVVIYVEKFNLKTGEIIKQHFLRGRGVVPKHIKDTVPLMDRKHFKYDQYIYAYTTNDRIKGRGGSTLLMLNNGIVESTNERIAIDTFIKAFKGD